MRRWPIGKSYTRGGRCIHDDGHLFARISRRSLRCQKNGNKSTYLDVEDCVRSRSKVGTGMKCRKSTKRKRRDRHQMAFCQRVCRLAIPLSFELWGRDSIRFELLELLWWLWFAIVWANWVFMTLQLFISFISSYTSFFEVSHVLLVLFQDR